MWFSILLTISATLSFISVITPPQPNHFVKNVSAVDPKIDPQHQEVLSRWLKTKPQFRLANELQDADKEGVAFYRQDWGKGFNPYYAVGDFNRDRRKDFAVLVVDSRKSAEEGFAIAIFNAPFNKKSRPNYFESGYEGVSRCFIAYDQMVRGRLFLGIYEADSICVTFYPKGQRYVYKDCEE